jgi:hypothetical protein
VAHKEHIATFLVAKLTGNNKSRFYYELFTAKAHCARSRLVDGSNTKNRQFIHMRTFKLK